MNKFSKGQLFTLIFTVGAFFVFSNQCAQNLAELIGNVISAIVCFLIILIIFRFTNNKNPDIFINSLMLAVLLCAGAGCIASFFNAQENADFGIDHKLLCAILLGFAVIYCASLHICAAMRSSIIIFALTLFSLVLLIVGAAPKFDISNIDLNIDIKNSLLSGFKSSFCSAGIPVGAALAIKTSHSQKQLGKYAASGVFFSMLLGVILSILAIFISSNGILTYFELAKSAQPFSVQSGEWIYIIIYAMLGILCLSVIVNLAADCLLKIFPKIKFKTTITAFLTFAFAYFMTYFSIDTETILISSSIGSAAIALLMRAKPICK